MADTIFGVLTHKSFVHKNQPINQQSKRQLISESTNQLFSQSVSFFFVTWLHAGNLPPVAVNYVAQTQPQNMAVFRAKLEAKYAADEKRNTDEMTVFQKRAHDLWRDLIQWACAQRQRAQLSDVDLTTDSWEMCEAPPTGLDTSCSRLVNEHVSHLQDIQLQADRPGTNSNNVRSVWLRQG